MKRIHSIDIIRGLVMIIMALDHTRDLIHLHSIDQVPTDLSTTTPVLFFTRWVTHICAPTFVFLSGASAYLSFLSKNNIAHSRRFLLSRGLWLIVLEFTLISFGLWFDIHFSVWLFDVIATIGFGFIVLGLLLGSAPKTIGIIGLAIIFLHNLAGLVPVANASPFLRSVMLLFTPGAIPVTPGTTFVMGYPPIPWLGVMLAGFGCGPLFLLDGLRRKKLFRTLGFVAIALFAVIRAINKYGDPIPWSKQPTGLYTFLSFINVTKYPPSLDFCLLMLGIMFLLLSAVEGVKNKFTDITTVYGKVPLFYFITHWYIIHPIMFLVVFMQGYKSSDLVFGFNFGRPKAPSGVNLWLIYIIWLVVVALLYPLCKWYGRYKAAHRHYKWLHYL